MEYTEEKALNLLNRYVDREKKLAHCRNVAKIARYISGKFIEKNINVDIDKIYFAAIVHDIGDKYRGEWFDDKHCEMGAEILRKEGLDEIAEIIKKHNVRSYRFEETIPKTWEEKIVFFSDKIEKNGNLMDIKLRKEKFLARFPDAEEEINLVFDQAYRIQKEILDAIGISYENLRNELEAELGDAL